MKNLSSKLFGGLATLALIIGSFSTSDVNAQAISMNDVTVEDVRVEEVAVADWYVLVGSSYAVVVIK